MRPGLLADHPEARERVRTSGAAAAQQRAKLVREDVFEAVVSILGREMILSKVAAAHGEERALAVADVLNLSPASWQNEREARMRATTQSTLYESPSSSYHEDARHHPLVTGAILRNAGTAEINRCIAQADELIRAEKSGRRTTGPDAPREKTQAPVQRSAVSSNPGAAYNADRDGETVQPPRRVSAPPMVASSREDA